MIFILAGLLYLMDEIPVSLLIIVTSFSVFIGNSSTPVFNKFGRYGDFSCGIYVYAFAVQQTVLWVVGKDYQFIPELLITAGITTVFAYLSWHFVESPALDFKKHFAKTATT